MGLIDMASGQSRGRGLDYYKDGNVLCHKRHNDKFVSGKVSGSNNNVYDVSIDLEHPVNSVCNCPYAIDTKRRVCKHMVALFCTTLQNPDKYFDDMVDDYNKKVDEHNKKVEELRMQYGENKKIKLFKFSKEELVDKLIDAYKQIEELEEYEYERW